MKIYSIILLIAGLGYGTLSAQSIFSPNYALKSPITVEILSIETVADFTTVNLSIENQLDEGYFCIDRNTYITTDKGERLKLSSLTGLPFCPENYRFTHKGEIKFFKMKFPAIGMNTAWIDLIEECGANCLSIYGLSLDLSLNAELNICFMDIEKGRIDDAVEKFEALRIKLKDSGNPILGSIYLNLISLYEETGESQKANELKNELSGLMIPHKEKFMALVK